MTTKTASIRVGDDVLARLDRLAKSMDRSRSWVIGQAIERYLDHEEWFLDQVEQGIAQADRGELIAHDTVMRDVRSRRRGRRR